MKSLQRGAYLNVMLIDTLFIHFHISLELWRAILFLCFLNLGAFMFILMAFLHQALNNFRILWQAMGNHPKHPSNCIVSWQKPLRKCNFRNRVCPTFKINIYCVLIRGFVFTETSRGPWGAKRRGFHRSGMTFYFSFFFKNTFIIFLKK